MFEKIRSETWVMTSVRKQFANLLSCYQSTQKVRNYTTSNNYLLFTFWVIGNGKTKAKAQFQKG